MHSALGDLMANFSLYGIVLSAALGATPLQANDLKVHISSTGTQTAAFWMPTGEAQTTPASVWEPSAEENSERYRVILIKPSKKISINLSNISSNISRNASEYKKIISTNEIEIFDNGANSKKYVIYKKDIILYISCLSTYKLNGYCDGYMSKNVNNVVIVRIPKFAENGYTDIPVIADKWMDEFK